MDKNIIINELSKYGVLSSDIKYIFKTGTYAFLKNYNDYDILVILNGYLDIKKVVNTTYNNKKVDIFIYSYETMIEVLTYKKHNKLSNFILSFIKQDLTLIDGIWNESFNFLETSEEYKRYLSGYIQAEFYKKYAFVYTKIDGQKYRLPKTFGGIYIPLLMIENNSIDLTDEYIDIITKSRDMNLDESLKEKVCSILDLKDDSIPFGNIDPTETDILQESFEVELIEIQNGFLENDGIPNKIIRKEWTEQDSRGIDYVNQCQIKRTRQDEIKNILGIN